MYNNPDLSNLITPVDADNLEHILNEANYDKQKSQFLVDGFWNGFFLGYQGRRDLKITAPNLKIGVGSELELWNKVMKEVKEKRYAGPFDRFLHTITDRISAKRQWKKHPTDIPFILPPIREYLCKC